MQGEVGKGILWVAAIQDWRQLSAPCAKPSSSVLGQVPRLGSQGSYVPTFGGSWDPQEIGMGANLGSRDPPVSCCLSEG